MNFSATEIRPNVYHFSFETKYFLTSTFMRLQEFYESPFDDIKGHYFSYEKYMDTYARNSEDNKFTYFEDWSGFNIPGNIVLDFYSKFKYDLLLKEKTLFDLILLFRHGKLMSKDKNRFYIIATHKGRREENDILHELSHAYWYLFPEGYADVSTDLLNNEKIINPKTVEIVKNKLKSMGYHKDMLNDELQAYFSTSSRYYLNNTIKYPKGAKLSLKFKKHFEQFDKDQRKQAVSKSLKKYYGV